MQTGPFCLAPKEGHITTQTEVNLAVARATGGIRDHTTKLRSLLDDEIRRHVHDLLDSGCRVPEEAFGPNEMRAAFTTQSISFSSLGTYSAGD